MIKTGCIICLLLVSTYVSHAQTFVTPLENYIYTAFPFLRIAPNARISAMGDAGTAQLNSGNIYSNASANIFMENTGGVSLDYKRSGNALLGLSGYQQIDDKNTWSAGMRYNSLGGTTVMTPSGSPLVTSNNYELAVDGNYSRRLSENFAAGVTLKYIYSTLSKGAIVNGVEIQPVSDIAADISCLYKKDVTFLNAPSDFTFGIAISNIGGKTQYGYPEFELFIPTNLSLGMAVTSKINTTGHFMFALDINKLLVPTLSLSDASVFSGMLHSFNDAPGGMSEELHEITVGSGMEYNFEDRLFVRGGYFYEHPTKGGRSFFSLGAGITFQSAEFDVAYRFYDNTQTIVIDNVLSVTLSVALGREKNAAE